MKCDTGRHDCDRATNFRKKSSQHEPTLVAGCHAQSELFHAMNTDVLRVFVNVPQTYASTIKSGGDAQVYLRDNPSKKYAGKATRTADALDPNTRTLLTEVQVPNKENELRPGMYLEVSFDFGRVSIRF